MLENLQTVAIRALVFLHPGNQNQSLGLRFILLLRLVLVELLDLPVAVSQGLALYLIQVHGPIFALGILCFYLKLLKEFFNFRLNHGLHFDLLNSNAGLGLHGNFALVQNFQWPLKDHRGEDLRYLSDLKGLLMVLLLV